MAVALFVVPFVFYRNLQSPFQTQVVGSQLKIDGETKNDAFRPSVFQHYRQEFGVTFFTIALVVAFFHPRLLHRQRWLALLQRSYEPSVKVLVINFLANASAIDAFRGDKVRYQSSVPCALATDARPFSAFSLGYV